MFISLKLQTFMNEKILTNFVNVPIGNVFCKSDQIGNVLTNVFIVMKGVHIFTYLTYSTVRKGQKTKPDLANRVYCIIFFSSNVFCKPKLKK